MSSAISPAAISALRDAQRRLVNGGAKSSDGRLTVANLAREAGVSRATVYRAGAIITEFRSMVRQRRSRAPPWNRSRRDHIAALEVQIATLKRVERKELRELRLKMQAMAQHVQALTLLTIEQRRRIVSLEGSQPAVRGVIGAVRATSNRAR